MVDKLLREKLAKQKASVGEKQTQSQNALIVKNAPTKDEHNAASEPLYILRYDD
jgi:hypothetical protein